jgi:hypothetical protein
MNQTHFENILKGFAFYGMFNGEEGHHTDLICVNANRAFNRITGIKIAINKWATEFFPGKLEKYHRVARTGRCECIGSDIRPVNRKLHISVYSPHYEPIPVIFVDNTNRPAPEETLRASGVRLFCTREIVTTGGTA